MKLAFLALICLTAQVSAQADGARLPPKVVTSPGTEYADEGRCFQGIPGIERAANGRLWATWYGGGFGEDKYNYVMLATSSDDGKTWSRPKLIIDPDGDGPCRAYDPCLWHDPQGRLWLFWSQRDKSVQMWGMVTENSGVEDPKWSTPRLVQPGIMLNKPAVLPSGEWLMPVATWKRDDSSKVVLSKDNGASFSLLGAANIPDPKDRNCDEHIIVPRTDGSLWMLVRTRYGIGQSMSADAGKTWSPVGPSALAHTASRFFIRRLKSGKLLLVKHGNMDEKTPTRSHLRAFLSDDDGRTWHGGLLIDEREKVTYPDAVEGPDGTIHLIYDLGRNRENQILMAVFTEEDVAKGEWSASSRQRVLVNQATGKRTK